MTANDTVIILLIGAGATAWIDLWALVRRRLFGTPLPNFGLVGRWIAHMARGRFRARLHRGARRRFAPNAPSAGSRTT